MADMTMKSPVVMTSEELLKHWQGHRNLTRRVIEAFPEDKLFSYSVGGMRPFAALALEMIGMATPGVVGMVSGKWEAPESLAHHTKGPAPKTKEELLRYWDEVTQHINSQWSEIREDRFQEIDVAFGMWEATIHSSLFYWIDNEIHHRGQGYVYLRSLGIEPPPFWER